MPDPILVWDLDKTLGFFEPLYKHWDPDSPVTIQFRPGILDLIRQLHKKGFTHRLLTLASPRAAHLILEAAGVRDLFFKIEGIGQRGKGDVAGIALEHGVPEHQWPHQFLFIGDHPFNDCPVDKRVIFHLEINALERPASQLGGLIDALIERGQGSFIRGYQSIASAVPWWKFWQRPAFQVNQAMIRSLPGLDPLALMNGPSINPLIAFENEPLNPQEPDLLTFTPNQIDLPEMPES